MLLSVFRLSRHRYPARRVSLGLAAWFLSSVGLALLMQMQGLATESAASFFSTPELVKDIWTGGAISGTPDHQVSRVGGRALFYARDPYVGTALWISDDSPQGAHLLTVLDARATTTPPITFWPIDAQGRTFFSADDGITGQSLWITDGTPEGTRRLTVQFPNVRPQEVVTFQAGIRFRGTTNDSAGSLWISDGTPEGTYPFLSADSSFSVNELREGDGGLYFFTSPNSGYLGGPQLWWTDGQSGNFKLIASFPDNDPEYADRPYILQMTPERTYLAVSTKAHDQELWVMEGAENSIRLVKDINPGKNSSYPLFFADLGGRMLFTAFTPKTGLELYATDGTPKGTVLLKNLGKGSADANPVFMARAGNQIYFKAQVNQDQTTELCVTDGTPKGTFIVGDRLSPGTRDPTLLGQYGEEVYFTGTDRHLKRRLWVVGGIHTVPLDVSAMHPGGNFTGPGRFITWDGGFAFKVDTDHRVWLSDGAAAGLRPLAPTPASTFVKSLAKAGPFLGFNSDDSRYNSVQVHHLASSTTTTLLTPPAGYSVTWGQEISPGRITFQVGLDTYATDGTREGTFMLGKTAHLEILDGHAWYASKGSDPGASLTLMKTDGTAAGTVPVHALPTPYASSDPGYLQTYGGHIYFSASDGVHGRELWRTDGTAEGTTLVKDILPGESGSEPVLIGVRTGLLYFTASVPIYGRELWRTDGTPEGTFMLRDIRYAAKDLVLTSALVEAAGKVYFTTTSHKYGYDSIDLVEQLWVTDGTQDGSRKVKDLGLYLGYGKDTFLTAYQGRLAFCDGGLAEGVWFTDGTPQGTVLHYRGEVGHLTVMDGRLYWEDRYDSYDQDYRLMRSTGTAGSITQLARFYDRMKLLLPRPPTGGDEVNANSWVLFAQTINGLYIHVSGGSGVQGDSYSGSGTSLFGFCGHHLIYTRKFTDPEMTSLYSIDGTSMTHRLLVSDGQSILAVTPQRIYFTRKNEQGTVNLESVRPDGSGRNVLAISQPAEGFNLAHVEQDRVLFSLGAWLYETSGTPATTRRIPTGIRSSPTSMRFTAARLGDQLYFPLRHPEVGWELHRMPLQSRPYLNLTAASGADLPLEENGVIELPACPVGQSRTRSLTLWNPGLQPLTDIAFTSADFGDFTLSPASVSSLAPGGSLTVQITFTPQTAGPQEVGMTLTAQGASGFPRSFILRGRAPGPEEAPEIITQPQSQLVLLGKPATFQTGLLIDEGVESSHWQRLPGPARFDTGTTLTLAGPQQEDIGRYTYHAETAGGEVTSNPVDLGLVQPTSAKNVAVTLHRGFQLLCYAKAPEGTRLTYQWLYQKQPLLSLLRITGTQAPILTVRDFTLADAGDYECIVTMHSADRSVSVSHGITTVGPMQPPNIDQPILEQPLQFFVGREVHYQLPLTFPAEGFISRGLPPGLVLSPTGLITGRPTKARPVVVDFQTEYDRPRGIPSSVLVLGANSAGVGEVSQIYITILPIAAQGNYVGLLPRHVDLAGGKNLGSQVQLTIAEAGSFSGRLTHGGKVYSFTSPKLPMDSPPEEFPTGYEIPISLGRNQPMLTLTLYANGGPELQARLRDDLGHVSQGTLGRQRAPIASDGEIGSYSIAIMPKEEPVMDPRVPPGIGRLLLTLSKTGTVSWKGKLADGTALTGSTLRICPYITDAPETCIHLPLYQATGSLHGKLLRSDGYFGESSLFGELTWLKAAETGKRSRVYPDGIPLHDLEAFGDLTLPLRNGQRFWDLPTSGYPLKLTFTGEGLPEAGLTQYAGITDTSRIRLDPENQALKSFSIDLKTRAIKGSFQVLPPDSTKPLNIPFEGGLTNAEGTGFFLIPEAPESGPLNPKTAPLRSGRVIIERVQ